MSDKLLLWFRGEITALEGEALVLIAIAVLWGWKAAAWAMLAIGIACWLTAIWLSNQWRKKGYGD